MVFNKWKGIVPKLSVENYEEERPLVLKAEEYRSYNLKEKSFRVLVLNKEEEQREKKIEANKKIIEDNIKKMIEEEE